MNIVLFEPEIPANTGNIGRTCVSTASSLHIVGRPGFSLSQKSVKRAGMDYWDRLKIYRYVDYEEFLEENQNIELYMVSTKGKKLYTDLKYGHDSYFMFGKESGGIPKEILFSNPDITIKIPMVKDNRSLNLANSVAIVLYEALRQHNFKGLE